MGGMIMYGILGLFWFNYSQFLEGRGEGKNHMRHWRREIIFL